MTDSTIAVLDIDGTLIDSNYQYALAWYRALRLVGETYPVWRLHRLIGMGGIADDWTSSADVEASKRAPDLLQVALEHCNR